MKAIYCLFIVFLFCSEFAPAQAPLDARKENVKLNINPYVPEQLNGVDPNFKVNSYIFSQRQLDYVASREFDEEKFIKYLVTKWPIEEIIEYTRNTRQERLPRKVGRNAGKYLEINVYQGAKHPFDSVIVSVADQYGCTIAPNKSFHADSEGKVHEIARWSWVITVHKGRK
jgi:hypothetical protein